MEVAWPRNDDHVEEDQTGGERRVHPRPCERLGLWIHVFHIMRQITTV